MMPNYGLISFPLLFRRLLARLLLVAVVSKYHWLREAIRPRARLRHNRMSRLALNEPIIMISILLIPSADPRPSQRHSIRRLLMIASLIDLLQSLIQIRFHCLLALLLSIHLLALTALLPLPAATVASVPAPLRTIPIILQTLVQIKGRRAILVQIAMRNIKHRTIIYVKKLCLGLNELYARRRIVIWVCVQHRQATW